MPKYTEESLKKLIHEVLYEDVNEHTPATVLADRDELVKLLTQPENFKVLLRLSELMEDDNEDGEIS